MKRRLRAVIVLLVFLLIVGVAISYGSKIDHTLGVLVLGLYVVSPAVLALKALLFQRKGRRHVFGGGGELELLPENWRRWLLDEKERPAPR